MRISQTNPASTQRARLPGLPAVQTGNAALDDFIGKVRERLEVREGERGSPYERVVTFRDLQNLGIATSPGAGGVPPDGMGIRVQGQNGSYFMLSIEQFANAIRSTALYQDLMKRLDDPTRFDKLPEQIRSILSDDIAAEAAKRGADISYLERKIQDADQSLAFKVSELTASIQNAYAGVRRVEYASATANHATAGYVTQVQARLDDFNGGGASFEEAVQVIADRTTGLSSQYTLKTNAGGAFAAIGLASTESTAGVDDSAIILVASKVAFVTDGETVGTGPGQIDPSNPDLTRIPFGVDASGVYINGQVRINAGGDYRLEQLAGFTFIGAFAAAPATADLKQNNVYLNTTDGNSYILSADGGAWSLFLQKGANGPAGANGANGANGVNGSDGQRGSMTLYANGTFWSDATANGAIVAATGSGARVIGDTVTISNTAAKFAATKYWSGSAWVDPGVIINGNLLVKGTISADQFDGTGLNIGNGRFFIDGIGTTVAYQISGGNATFTNGLASLALPAITGRATNGSSDVAIWGYSQMSSGNGHSIRGQNVNGSSGLVGPANGFDFYAEGSGTNYGPFTGTHEGLTPNDTPIGVGELVADVECIERQGWSGTVFSVELTSAPRQKGVLGLTCAPGVPLASTHVSAFIDHFNETDGKPVMRASFDTYKDTHNVAPVNAVGEGQMQVTGEGGDIARGEFLCTSSTPGKAMRQTDLSGVYDGTHRDYTVARAREAVTFSSPDEVKTIACIYLCG